MRHRTVHFTTRVAALIFAFALGWADPMQAQSDDFGLTESETATLVAFGDLLDFIDVFEPLQDVVDGFQSTVTGLTGQTTAAIDQVAGLTSEVEDVLGPAVSGLASDVEETVNDITGDVAGQVSGLAGDVGSAVGTITNTIEPAVNAVESTVNGLVSTVNSLSSTVSALSSAVDGLNSLNPFGMILAEVDGVEVMLNSEGNVVPVTVIVPTVDAVGQAQPITLVTNPVVWEGDDWPVVPGYETAPGNDWGKLWINPTLHNPTILGDVHGLNPGHIGLGEVDNTADMDKPVSLAAQAALDTKVSIGSDAPDGADASCTAGEVVMTETHLFVCISDNTWRRTAVETDWN